MRPSKKWVSGPLFYRQVNRSYVPSKPVYQLNYRIQLRTCIRPTVSLVVLVGSSSFVLSFWPLHDIFLETEKRRLYTFPFIFHISTEQWKRSSTQSPAVVNLWQHAQDDQERAKTMAYTKDSYFGCLDEAKLERNGKLRSKLRKKKHTFALFFIA